MSLSARRAWIEIVKLFRQNYECFVALRKESVDRNQDAKPTEQAQGLSLSARRAWIEIDTGNKIEKPPPRSLSARRAWIEISKTMYHKA